MFAIKPVIHCLNMVIVIDHDKADSSHWLSQYDLLRFTLIILTQLSNYICHSFSDYIWKWGIFIQFGLIPHV